MKKKQKQQRDHLAVASSSSLSFNPSESDPEDSFWRDFTFDFSFLTSDDPNTVLPDDHDDDIDPNALPKESEELFVDSNVSERKNESSFSPLFAKMSALRIKECSVDETEVDSPCWKGGAGSLNLRRSRDDLNVLYGLNPMAPQFIPSSSSNAKMSLDKNGKELPSLKRSLSSTFPPASSGEFNISNLYEAGSDQTNIIHDADESLGLVCQDSVFEFQRPKKLDPLAPVFVPAYALVHENSGAAADQMMAPEVGRIGSNLYESGITYSSNPRIMKLDSSSDKTHGLKKKLNPLAPQFSLADAKPKLYRSVENQAPNDLPTNVNSSVLSSPVGYRNHKELLYAGFAQPSKQMGRHYPNMLHGNPSPQMDVKKLLTTIHGLSELLTHVHGLDGSPNEQDLDLVNSTVRNLNSYISNRVQEHAGKYCLTSLPNMCKQSPREHQIPKARNLSASVDFERKEKYSMVSGEIGVEAAPFENGFGQVVRNGQTEEQINPQVLFYKSLWLKARADRSLMEYETFLSNSRT